MFFIENRLVNKPEEGVSSHHMHINAHTSRWLVGMCLSLVWHIPLFFWSQNPKIHFSVASLHTVFFYLMPTARVGSLECFSWAIDWPGTIYAIHTASKRYGIITPAGRKYHDPKLFSTMWLWEVLWCVGYYFHLCLAWSLPKNRATRWKYRWPPTDWHLCDLWFQFHLCMKPDLCPSCLATAINSLFWLS